jgi:2-dehydropantoate 2-reductase
MRHAVLGAGGIGGLLAAALARAGGDVELLVRPQALDLYDGTLHVESATLGDFAVDVPARPALKREVDAVWVATKATGLEEAMALAPPRVVADAVVVPLLNGIDHVALLRTSYPNVVAGAIRVESERTAPGRIRQSSPFLRVELAGAAGLAEELRGAGIECRSREDETSLLWDKLAFLAPVALATTALDAPLGAVRGDERFGRCRQEAVAVAGLEGAVVDAAALASLHAGAPAAMRSSMQKDVAAGRPPELDAIAGPILRGGARYGIPVSGTSELARMVELRMRA